MCLVTQACPPPQKKMADVKWNVPREDQLIELWEERPCLYDTSSRDYSNRQAKTKFYRVFLSEDEGGAKGYWRDDVHVNGQFYIMWIVICHQLFHVIHDRLICCDVKGQNYFKTPSRHHTCRCVYAPQSERVFRTKDSPGLATTSPLESQSMPVTLCMPAFRPSPVRSLCWLPRHWVTQDSSLFLSSIGSVPEIGGWLE